MIKSDVFIKLSTMHTKIVFGWTDLRGFTVQEDGFKGMKVVWLT